MLDLLMKHTPAFVFTQEYETFSSVHLVVKASLVLDTQAQNMVLRTPDTTVCSSSSE